MASLNDESNSVELTSEKFEDLDLDSRVKKVLKTKGYIYLTRVQSKILPLALQGKNLVIQSPTGSGKTLCFLLPAIKLLFEEGYSGNLPGDISLLGCVCLAPTRELASQSAIQMRDLATPLKLNAGCCIGGIRDKYDKSTASRLHILTGTPGRVLALLSSKALSDTTNVKILVLDEADRLLDSGFRNSILEIVDLLPPSVQILLFSATIKSSLKELCSIMLQDGNYEFVCLGSDTGVLTESYLRQEFVVITQKLKLAALFHILSKSQNKRVLVFLPTCKQVRFVYEVFKRLIPAIPMTELHGKQSQLKRMDQFTKFAAKQEFGCIFTTDVAARGIDFPVINLIIQMDLPDSVDTYTHRVGRAGRLTIEGTRSFGRTVVFIQECEIDFLTRLRTNGIRLHDQTKLLIPLIMKRQEYVLRKLQSILAKESWIKEMAQRAIVAHLRYMVTRPVAPMNNLQLMEHIKDFSLSMGLPSAPNIQLQSDQPDAAPRKSKLAKLKDRIKQRQAAQPEPTDPQDEEDAESEEEILIERGDPEEDLTRYSEWRQSTKDPSIETEKALAVNRKRLRINRRGVAKLRGLQTIRETEEKHLVFSDDDDDDDDGLKANEYELPDPEQVSKGKADYLDRLKAKMQAVETEDRSREAARVNELHARRKKVEIYTQR
ncbi:bifunctional ATP-dependent RNA helicase DEAD-box [Babesia duncani]|uniref:ATP-dependent RNA helicase n=1 Tax=Babesia duncani TaxID=323732 RepID=A0AAD9UN95_9APIC|nr:bifunctional ATP-dependent RNA helicase DEAD-box [Babesia duncani]